MLIFIGSLLLVVIIIFEFSLIYGCYYFTRYESKLLMIPFIIGLILNSFSCFIVFKAIERVITS